MIRSDGLFFGSESFGPKNTILSRRVLSLKIYGRIFIVPVFVFLSNDSTIPFTTGNSYTIDPFFEKPVNSLTRLPASESTN
jgi:hypothetical protein